LSSQLSGSVFHFQLIASPSEVNYCEIARVQSITAGRGMRHSEYNDTYLLSRRIEVAQGLLLTTCEPLTSIALACGMYDHSHFTRAFRRVVGKAPYFWRRTRSSAFGQRRARQADPAHCARIIRYPPLPTATHQNVTGKLKKGRGSQARNEIPAP
jgi:AraC-like DNA-binding protein